MKLLLLNYEYPPVGGGAGNATKFIAREFTLMGCETTVITSGHRQSKHETTIEDGVELIRLNTGREEPDRATFRDMASYIFHAIRWINRNRNHPQTMDASIAFFSIIGGPVAHHLRKQSGVPYLISLRGGDVPTFSPEITWLHQIIQPARRHWLKGAFATIANSPSLAHLAMKTDGGHVITIPNGVDTTLFHPPSEPPCEQDHPLRILFVGRIHEQKNLAVLLRALSLPDAQNLPPWELHIVGDGPHKNKLRSLAYELRINGLIRWHGWKSAAELADIYRSSDLLIQPSLYEGMSNVLLEAMASGLPILANDIPPNRTCISHGESGLLFDASQPQSLLSTICEIAHNPTQATQLGKNARARSIEHFSWQNTARQYRAILDKMIASK